MITSEVREELKNIQSELKKVFPANRHEVRDLPGGQRKWVYLKWQTIRERLDEVCPDWIIDEGGNLIPRQRRYLSLWDHNSRYPKRGDRISTNFNP